jgi:prepilin peptidase CpaA
MMIQPLLLLSLLAFPALVLVGAARDLASYTIPNWISLALTAAFVPAAGLALAAGAPLPDLAICVAVGAVALLAGIAMFSLGWIGGGDAKLFAACSLWLGVAAMTPFLFWTAAAGGVLSVLLMTVRRLAPEVPGDAWYARLMTKGEPVPYGLAICAGALAAFPQSVLAQLVL